MAAFVAPEIRAPNRAAPGGVTGCRRARFADRARFDARERPSVCRVKMVWKTCVRLRSDGRFRVLTICPNGTFCRSRNVDGGGAGALQEVAEAGAGRSGAPRRSQRRASMLANRPDRRASDFHALCGRRRVLPTQEKKRNRSARL